ncbi:MAG: entericidin A/B family lipoprotein [Burkholderiaceae bacterium]|jgi:entericidin A|nr:entericidin A/B family lipoprotein [Oxalobacteraceae bacterium]
MKKIALLIFSVYLLAACNTINGIGKDVEKLGEKVQGASKK